MSHRFTIITPCRNAERYIEETVCSVLEQTAVRDGLVELDYIVCDGGSTDRTLEILRRLEHPCLRVYSEPDRGMYDALVKGFRRAGAGYIAYLNAGDYFHPGALRVVAGIFDAYPMVCWLTGLVTVCNERSEIAAVETPYVYRRKFFENGFHGTRLPGVQQESTFWRSELCHLIDEQRLVGLRLAGDFYLWWEFSRQHTLYVVSAQLGAFKRHPGQQSENRAAYHRELLSLVRPSSWSERWLAFWDRLVWLYPNAGLKMRLGRSRHFIYDFGQRRWCAFAERTPRGGWR